MKINLEKNSLIVSKIILLSPTWFLKYLIEGVKLASKQQLECKNLIKWL